MSKVVPVREFRNNLSDLLSYVVDRKDHVLITRNGRPAAVLLSIEEYESMEETIEILSDPETMAALEEGFADFERGDTVTLEEVRRELAERRAGG